VSQCTQRILLMSALVVAIAVVPSTCKANSIIFSTFGPGHSYLSNSGWGESGSSTAAPDIVAMAFTPSATTTLGSIDVAIGWGGNGSRSLTLALMTNNGGVPGTILENWNVTSTYSFGSCGTCFETVFDKKHLILQAGVEYWLVPFPNSSFDGAWNDNSVGAFGSIVESLDGGNTWSPTTAAPNLGAFDVKTTVPEPGTLLLLGSGLLGIVGKKSKKLFG